MIIEQAETEKEREEFRRRHVKAMQKALNGLTRKITIADWLKFIKDNVYS